MILIVVRHDQHIEIAHAKAAQMIAWIPIRRSVVPAVDHHAHAVCARQQRAPAMLDVKNLQSRHPVTAA
jgi:hypothetical protein